MALKAVLDNLDNVEDALKTQYVEKDGKFFLDLDDDIKTHPKTVALKNALDRQKVSNEELTRKLAEADSKVKDVPAEFTLDEWHRLKELDDEPGEDAAAKAKRKEKADQRLAEAKKNYEQQIANLKLKYDTDMAAKDTELGTERQGRAKDKADIELDKALDKANIDPKFRPAVRALQRDAIKSVFEDGEVRIFVPTDLGETSVLDHIENWARSDDGKVYVSAATGPLGQGGPRQTNLGANPFTKAHWNKTEQAAARLDPVRGERLATAAGFKSLTEALGATHARDAA